MEISTVVNGNRCKTNNTNIIPNGIYCYTIINGKRERCPYWSLSESHEYQNNGYCSYLQQGDWDNKCGGLLWDSIKECNINNFLECDE